MKKNVRIVIVLACVVGLLALVRVALNQPPDEVLIQTALTEAILASKEGRDGPVLQFISKRVSYNGQESTDRRSLGKYIKQYRPDVTIVNPRPVIQGDWATITSPVTVEMSLLNIGGKWQIPEATISLRRETALKWLVVPTSIWRVKSVDAPAGVPLESIAY